MRSTLFLVALVLATMLAGCTEVVRQYRADESGKLRHVKTFVPEWGPVGKHVSYTINGVTFSYDLSAIRGDLRGHRHAPAQLSPGKDFLPFHAMVDAPFLEGALGAPGVTVYGGSIVALPGARSTNSDIFRVIKAQGLGKEYLKKSRAQDYRSINGLRWLVTDTSEDGAPNLVRGRAYWTIEAGFLVTLYVNFTSAPRDPSWRETRLRTLEEIVSGFQMQRSVTR